MNDLTHLSLFTGIGGIDHAAEWAGFKTIGQVEINPYCIKVLEKHWPEIKRWTDVKELTGKEIIRIVGRPTLISAGFPCQPHSTAGKRKASCDDRDLWPELRRILCEVKPGWFLGENVAGLRSSESGRFFGRVLGDLAEMGYSVGWGSWEAADVGAPHHRERVFIVAHTISNEHRTNRREIPEENRIPEINREKVGGWGVIRTDCDVTNTNNSKTTRQREDSGIISGITEPEGSDLCHSDDPNIDNKHREEHQLRNQFRQERGEMPIGRSIYEPSWQENWITVATRLCRVDDGVSNRVHRLTALGNAVVPQQVYPILKEIVEVEKRLNEQLGV